MLRCCANCSVLLCCLPAVLHHALCPGVAARPTQQVRRKEHLSLPRAGADAQLLGSHLMRLRRQQRRCSSISSTCRAVRELVCTSCCWQRAM